jgi:hypothetical protein
MLQLLYLNVSKVDRVLHMGCVWESTSGAGDVRGRHWPTARALAHNLDSLGARSLAARVPSDVSSLDQTYEC